MSHRVTFVELDLNRCSLSYGVGACTAAGSEKCFNTRPTCQDKPNFSTEVETVRFCIPSSNVSPNVEAIPSVVSVDYTPARLDLGESIGVRASASISFGDHRYPDTGAAGDRYASERIYNAYETGTFWGKFRARHSVIKGAAIRIIHGEGNQAIEQMETHHLIVESVVGPDSGGRYTITAKDVLKLADPKRAQAPHISSGYLNDPILAADTTATLAPPGIGNLEYPASGLAAIGGAEIVAFTRSADALTLTRAQQGTTAQDHDDDDRVQICIQYTGADPADIMHDLLTVYAGIDPNYIPLTTWQTETANYVGRLYTAVIAEPTSVTELVNEVLQQSATSMWWDDIAKLIRIRTLRAVPDAANVYNDDIIVAGSYAAKDQPGKRVSQVWTYYALKNPLEGIDDPKNYRSAVATIDSESEVDYGDESIRTIFSRWIPAFGRDAAKTLNDLILSRYASPPRMFGFKLLRDDYVVQPEPAGGYKISTLMLQGPTGEQATADFQATSVKSGDAFIEITGEEVLYSQTITPPDPDVRNITIDTNATNLNIRTIYDSLYAAPDALTTVNVYIEAGVVIGSTSTSLYSLRTGTWPTVLTLNIFNNGRIEGIGGTGGTGANISVDSGWDLAGTICYAGSTGGAGGNALLVEHDSSITNNSEIWAGGGGGGGGGSFYLEFSWPGPYGSVPYRIWRAGGGGGGGGGYLSSAGGGSGSYPGDLNTTMGGTAGDPGVSGSQTAGGAGGDQLNHLGAALTVGGNGGGPGLSGLSGTATTTSSAAVAKAGTAGAGGAPGNAIVQSGAVASIITTGDIRGAIV